ncbi:hypothetical protein [Pedobacter miscanthi]|uniref:DUF4270 domain-containing protein n=1 Tax=Pedobacter miscanthi TaxID=2259170 RepID=A0A366L312_9SPHI|nr:hypothetical protein [Pedobacter miscanthi]RBQ07869.1 hypothetical protein DRW42_09715 [Pedobacter miscanthi]
MKRRLINLGILLFILLFGACKKEEKSSVSLQPQVFRYAEKNTVVVGGQSIQTGPLKDYEQGSDVVYQLTVSSELPLTKFTVTTNTDVFSLLSHVIRTEPENAIDEAGNFRADIKKVVVYYAYRIDDSIIPLTTVNPVFTFQNESNYAGQSYDNFQVIKKGSTNGKLLKVANLSWLKQDLNGIGNQESFDIISNGRPDNNVRYQNKRGTFYSLDLRADVGILTDALINADKFDFAGYFPRAASTDPKSAMLAANYYLVSPADTTVLGYSYIGSRQAGLALLGTSGTGTITVAGITKTVTYATNTTVTATNFVNANRAEFAAKGLVLTSTTNNLLWVASVKGAYSDPATFTNLTGTLMANPYWGAGEGALTFRKVLDLRQGIRQMWQAAKSLPGKSLKTTYFRRLDNVTGKNKITATDFDLLTHDNEFDVFLQGIKEEQNTVAGPMSWDQVYGFVTSDGKRGLIRTLPKSVLINGVLVALKAPNDGTSDLNLYCVIKYQQQ